MDRNVEANSLPIALVRVARSLRAGDSSGWQDGKLSSHGVLITSHTEYLPYLDRGRDRVADSPWQRSPRLRCTRMERL